MVQMLSFLDLVRLSRHVAELKLSKIASKHKARIALVSVQSKAGRLLSGRLALASARWALRDQIYCNAHYVVILALLLEH